MQEKLMSTLDNQIHTLDLEILHLLDRRKHILQAYEDVSGEPYNFSVDDLIGELQNLSLDINYVESVWERI